MKTIGTVISTFEGPSTYQFNFVIKEDSGEIPVHKGQFIQLKTEEGILIGRIDEVIKTNRYFMQAESVREYEKSGKPLMDMFPVDRWEYLVAKTTTLGVYNNGLMKRVTYPPSPGSTVKEVDKNILTDFLGLDSDGLNIGKIAFHDLDAKINLTRLFHKHLAILAISGAGKSHLVSVFVEELLERSEELGKPAIIVIDPHGEYVGFAEDENYSKKTKVFSKESPLSISASSLSPYQIIEFLPQISPVQRRELIKIIQDLKNKKKYYGFKELIKAIEDSEIKKVTKDTMISWISNLNITHLFSNVNYPSINDLAKPGQLSIIDLSGFNRLNEKQIIVTSFARKLFNARRQEKIPPFILVLEESHQFCPEGVERQGAISKEIIETIAREGRKFHASLVLISQRPIQLSTTALSQCNSQILLRILNPYDLKHIGESNEAITSDLIKTLPGLQVGEAVITGNAVNHPLFVQIRPRKSKESSRLGINFEDAIRSFNNGLKKNEKDLETFM
ncbi:MAG: ATP-binding protein [Candidatus Aenigmarchaeota archaeon]|nr:ATP-binding protein [Candidatus Aenigmarchaeota archaeon]